ncbi:MAG: acyl carrier protein [Lacisediminimonas sp.]|nr:acyl carrier protein [Lacisediminimonas sp.]
MDREMLRQVVLETLRTIAPEVEPASLQDDAPLRDQVDLDSMDWLNFLVRLHQRLQVDIPEADYRQLSTLNRLLSYLTAKLA